MNQLQLYINDQLVDLSDDTPIALTFQINNLAEVQNQQGNTSNQFKLPLTQRNRQILGFPDDIAFTSNLPYQKYQAKIIQDGLEIVPYGLGELNGIDQDSANITILSGNTDFFDAIGGKLYDMGDSTSIWSNYGQNLVWQPYDHKWNIDNIANSQTNTDGWIYPIIDYGAMTATEDFSQPIAAQNLRPGFFIKTTIDLLLKSAGYKGTGSLLTNPLYPLIICQFSNGSWQHGTDIQNSTGFKSIMVQTGQNITVQHMNTSGSLGEIPFSAILSDISHCYNANANGYFVSEITSVTASFSFALYFSSKNRSHKGYSSKVDIQIRLYNDINTADGDAPVLATITFDYADRGTASTMFFQNQTLSFDQVLEAGQGIKITYQFSGYTGSMFTLDSGAVFSVQNKVQDVQYGQVVQCERIFPDIAQKDLLKDTLQRFGIICQTDNTSKTVSFNSFRDIVNNIAITKDWSGKCLNQGKQVGFQLGNYAQVNYMQYQTDQNLLPLKYGWSQIKIADQTLPASATLVQSPFGPSFNRPYYGGSIAQITMIDQKSDNNSFSISVAPRILIDQKLDLRNIGKTVTLTDGINPDRVINDIISTPYFYKPDAPNLGPGYGQASLMFEDLRKQYYPELEKILTQTKKVVRYILLSPRDILELDLLIPIYIQQDGAYYYINKIDAWRKGQPTKVELVKLG